MGARIVAILGVVDTREYVEDGDRFVPVPGSGVAHDCARCGRSHEVHAEVRLSDGTTAVVGTGCMTADEMDVASRARSAERTAKTLARARAEYAAAVERWNAYEAARAEVHALTAPPIETGSRLDSHNGRSVPILTMGDEMVWCRFSDEDERRSTLLMLWRSARLRERGYGHAVASPKPFGDHVAKLEARLAKLIAGVVL